MMALVGALTLQARCLVSSRHCIALEVIELLRNKMFSGELGPATVVGSAAFNLFVLRGTGFLALSGLETAPNPRSTDLGSTSSDHGGKFELILR